MMKNAYRSLAVQTDTSRIYCIPSFFTIDNRGSFYKNLNMLYMMLTIVAPIVVLTELAMRDVVPSGRANIALLVGLVVTCLGCLALIRTQTTNGNLAFLRSKVPNNPGPF